MGCDIHMHFEYHSSLYTDKKDEWYNGDYFKRSIRDIKEYEFVDMYPNRCYSLFAVLANVRNYDPGLIYIDEPRGLPEDINIITKHQYIDWEWGAHSTSYFTLKEILDFSEKHEGKEEAEILKHLIEIIKRRADELNLIYDFQWNGQHCEKAYDKADKIRIVFWFDN